jgi:hypothetical protein
MEPLCKKIARSEFQKEIQTAFYAGWYSIFCIAGCGIEKKIYENTGRQPGGRVF